MSARIVINNPNCRLCGDYHEPGEPCGGGLGVGIMIALPVGTLLWSGILWLVFRAAGWLA